MMKYIFIIYIHVNIKNGHLWIFCIILLYYIFFYVLQFFVILIFY